MLQRAVCFFKDSKLLLLANIDSIGSGTVSVGKILLFHITLLFLLHHENGDFSILMKDILFHIYDIYCWRLLKGAFSLLLCEGLCSPECNKLQD